MDDLIKDRKESGASVSSNSNAREMALELSFDKSAFDSLGSKPKKKRTNAASVASEAPSANKKPKLQEVEGIDPVLLALQMKKNEARAVAKKATSEEETLLAAGPHAAKHKAAAEAKVAQREFKEKLAEAGVNPEFYSQLHETQESVEAAEKRKNRRSVEDASAFGT